MGLIPVPEEVKNMHGKIDKLAESVQSLEKLMDRVLTKLDKLSGSEEALKDFGKRLNEFEVILQVIRDHVRMK